MTTISDKDRTEAQVMAESLAGTTLPAMSDDAILYWLNVRDRVFDSHKCPSTDRRPLKHYRHPRLDGQTECPECGYLMHEHGWLDCGGDGIVVCPSLHSPFGGQAVTDYARNHTCQPVWRPTTSAEIQPGWEVRSRSETGMPSSWGIAHHRNEDGDWRTWPEDAVLTYDADGWTCETTAPVPEPKPKPNPARIQVVLDWASEPPGPDRHADAADLLTRLDNLKENTP